MTNTLPEPLSRKPGRCSISSKRWKPGEPSHEKRHDKKNRQACLSQKADMLRKQSELLLMMFDELARSEDPRRDAATSYRHLLNRIFDLHEVPVFRSFTGTKEPNR